MLRAFPKYKSLWQKLYREQGEKHGNYIYLEKNFRKELITAVRKDTLKEKMEFSSCREGFQNLNTTACDGSSFLV